VKKKTPYRLLQHFCGGSGGAWVAAVAVLLLLAAACCRWCCAGAAALLGCAWLQWEEGRSRQGGGGGDVETQQRTLARTLPLSKIFVVLFLLFLSFLFYEKNWACDMVARVGAPSPHIPSHALLS
jgi:hypothetical protein